MDALGNEPCHEQKQEPEQNANEGSQPTEQKPAIAPPHGRSAEEEQCLPPASSTEVVAMDVALVPYATTSHYGLPPALAGEAVRLMALPARELRQTGAGSQPTRGALTRQNDWLDWNDDLPEWESWQML